MRMPVRRLTPPLLGLAAWWLAACGSSETTTPPPVPANPFEGAVIGTDSTLEVMTWNVQNFPREGMTTVDLVVNAVAALDVDIVALQEIQSGYYFQQVVDRLDDWDGLRATTAYADINLAFLYRNDDSLVLASAPYEIMTDEGYFFPRRPYVIDATFRGRPVVVINNHLKAMGDAESQERRRQACLLLESYVLANFPDTPVIILGDMNDELDDPLPGNVFANFLADTASWRFVDLGFTRSAGGPVSYPRWPSHLDHILITDELFVAAEKAEALVQVLLLETYLPGGLGAYYRDLSDHRPVVLRISP